MTENLTTWKGREISEEMSKAELIEIIQHLTGEHRIDNMTHTNRPCAERGQCMVELLKRGERYYDDSR